MNQLRTFILLCALAPVMAWAADPQDQYDCINDNGYHVSCLTENLVPKGGTDGQVLIKGSNDDWNTVWSSGIGLGFKGRAASTDDSGAYALLAGLVNGSNKTFTVPDNIYEPGTVVVHWNNAQSIYFAEHDASLGLVNIEDENGDPPPVDTVLTVFYQIDESTDPSSIDLRPFYTNGFGDQDISDPASVLNFGFVEASNSAYTVSVTAGGSPGDWDTFKINLSGLYQITYNVTRENQASQDGKTIALFIESSQNPGNPVWGSYSRSHQGASVTFMLDAILTTPTYRLIGHRIEGGGTLTMDAFNISIIRVGEATQ